MNRLKEDLLYTRQHEWVRFDLDGTAYVGITDYAQRSLGDITFIELPKVGTEFKQGAVLGVVESVKAASDIYTPIAGIIAQINTNLENSPDILNKSPYEEGWLVQLKTQSTVEEAKGNGLLSEEEYQKLIR